LKAPSDVRRPHLWLLGGVAVVLAAVLFASLRASRTHSDEAAGVLRAAPDDAWLVLTFDVAAARPLLEPLLRSGGISGATRAAGLGSLSAACGFEPLEHLRDLMVAVPEGGEQERDVERGDFGVAFSADLTVQQLAACARKAIAARGGAPVASRRGDFVVIGDVSAPDQARLAYRDGGPFLVGRGSWLDAMVDAAGRASRGPSPHDVLRAALAPAGAPARALVVTALLPKSLRERVRAETDAGPGGAFAGVLGVERAGAAVTTSDATTAVEVDLRCETAAACGDVEELIEKGRRGLSGDFAARLMGLGPLIDGLSVDAATPGSLFVRTRAPTRDVADVLERLWTRLPARSPGGAPYVPVPPPPPAGADR